VRFDSLLSIIFGLAVVVFGCGASGADRTGSGFSEPDSVGASAKPWALGELLDPLTTVTGRVLTKGGVAIAGALIEPTPLNGQEWAEYESTRRTDPDGRYQLPLASGLWLVRFWFEGFAPANVRVDVPRTGLVRADVVLERP
jgi:hypothetical protein